MWSRARIGLTATFVGGPALAIVERCRALGWAPSADEPNIPDVDSEWVEEGESLETYLAQAKEFVRLYYDGYPGVIEIYISGSPRTTVGRAGVEVDVATLAATLSTIPFEVAIFGDLYVTGPEPTPFGGYYPPRVESGLPLGWAIAFRGKGHDWLVSKRWLASGPGSGGTVPMTSMSSSFRRST